MATSQQMPRLIWEDGGQTINFDGHPITLASYRLLYTMLVKETQTMLDRLMRGMLLPDFHCHDIVDNLSDRTPGYSFITDMHN